MSRVQRNIGQHGQIRPWSVARKIRKTFRNFVLRFVAPISRHPAMTLITGVGLFLSGSFELAEQIFTNFDSKIHLHQGVILLGMVTFLRGLADLVEASEWLSKGADQEEAKAVEIKTTEVAETDAVSAEEERPRLSPAIAELYRRFG